MIIVIIILFVLLFIINLNKKYIEEFGDMSECNEIKGNLTIDGIGKAATKMGNCITGLTGEIETLTAELGNIDGKIITFINRELGDLVPIGDINSVANIFKNPKKEIYDPLCLAFYDITGMTTCKAARDKEDEDNA
jgi:hypothetical protein